MEQCALAKRQRQEKAVLKGSSKEGTERSEGVAVDKTSSGSGQKPSDERHGQKKKTSDEDKDSSSSSSDNSNNSNDNGDSSDSNSEEDSSTDDEDTIRCQEGKTAPPQKGVAKEKISAVTKPVQQSKQAMASNTSKKITEATKMATRPELWPTAATVSNTSKIMTEVTRTATRPEPWPMAKASTQPASSSIPAKNSVKEITTQSQKSNAAAAEPADKLAKQQAAEEKAAGSKQTKQKTMKQKTTKQKPKEDILLKESEGEKMTTKAKKSTVATATSTHALSEVPENIAEAGPTISSEVSTTDTAGGKCKSKGKENKKKKEISETMTRTTRATAKAAKDIGSDQGHEKRKCNNSENEEPECLKKKTKMTQCPHDSDCELEFPEEPSSALQAMIDYYESLGPERHTTLKLKAVFEIHTQLVKDTERPCLLQDAHDHSWPLIIDFEKLPGHIFKLHKQVEGLCSNNIVFEVSIQWKRWVEYAFETNLTALKWGKMLVMDVFRDLGQYAHTGYYGAKGASIIGNCIIGFFPIKRSLKGSIEECVRSVVTRNLENTNLTASAREQWQKLPEIKWDFMHILQNFVVPYVANALIAEDTSKSEHDADVVRVASQGYGEEFNDLDDNEEAFEDINICVLKKIRGKKKGKTLSHHPVFARKNTRLKLPRLKWIATPIDTFPFFGFVVYSCL
ncbi:unnamed protein product [Cyclocybe aegerita]|uniref:Uncharacterized protein n=1 Tax=Cyclocybe aegerita TaxID=1973307 RepID=A0A8S0VZ36_CYCAE|nr:unnamed protein product [Cyclocybe aegerita]